MYRPTVRYDDAFKKYVDDVFHATNLDRNQIIRMGLFLLGHTEHGKMILTSHLKSNSSLPSPLWEVTEHRYFYGQRVKNTTEGGTSNGGTSTTGTRQLRKIQTNKTDSNRTTGKGIKIVL